MKDEKKIGIIIAYISMIASTVTNIFLTPFLIRHLGATEYGVYQIVNSFAAYLLIADLGTGTLMTRFLSVYMVKDDKKAQENYVAIGFIITAICSMIIILGGIILYNKIDILYSNTLSSAEIEKAKILFIMMVINIGISVFYNSFYGIVNAYKKFIITKSLSLMRIIGKVVLNIIMLAIGLDSIALVTSDLIITCTFLIIISCYCFLKLNVKVKLYNFDINIVLQSLSFAVAVLFQSIVNQVNNNVDKMILGSMSGPDIVSIYSIGMVVFTSYNILANTIGSVYLPSITQKVYSGANNEELTSAVIPPGRINFIVCGLIIITFALYGKDFISFWVGDEYLIAYYIALILMIPYIIQHMQSVTGCILDAKNKRIVVSTILVLIAVVNVIGTIILIKGIGYIGAPIATAISVILGHGLLLNLYYRYGLGLNVKRMLSEILKGVWKALTLTLIFSIPLSVLETKSILIFVIKCCITAGIFFILLYLIGLNNYEKLQIELIMKRFIKK